MKKLIGLLFLIPLLLSAVKVEVSVNKYTLSTDDQLELTLKISDATRMNVSEPQPPKVPLFTFRNMTSSSAASSVISLGKSISEHSQTYRYIYFPTQTGTSTIPSIVVKVNNREYRTRPMQVSVVKGAGRKPSQNTAPTPGYNPFSFNEPDFYGHSGNYTGDTRLIALPETQNVFRGFPAIVSYYLYSDIAVRSFNLEEERDFSGYGKKTYEQPTMLNYEDVTYNGKRYKRALIKRLAIMPNQEGELQAPTLTGIAREFNFGYSNQTLVSKGGRIIVKALPASNVPSGFSGAVGNFKLSHSVSKHQITLGEAVTFTLKISGKGNFNQFTPPLFVQGKGFQVSSPVVVDNLSAGIEGTRTYYYTLVPQDKGNLQLPELRFVWFAHDAGVYQVYTSPSDNIEVKSAHVLSYLNRLWERRNPRAMAPKLLRESYPDYHLIASQPWYWVLVFVILIGTLVFSYIAWEHKLKTSNPETYARNKADNILQRYMKQAIASAKELSVQFYPQAEKALMNYLAAKYKLSGRLSTPEKLQALKAESIPMELVEELSGFLNTCNSALYMPENERAINLQHDVDRLKNIISGFARLSRTRRQV